MASQNTIAGEEASSSPQAAQDDAAQEEVKADPENTPSQSNAQDDASQLEDKADSEPSPSPSPTTIELLKSIDSKITPQEIHLKELALLQKIQKQLQSESTKTQFIWNAFLQVFGLVFVVIFGAFSIIAFRIGEQANIQSSQANQLALLSFCFTTNSSTVEGLCGDVFHLATQTLPPLVTVVMGLNPSATGNSTTLPPVSSKKMELSIGIALAFCVFAGIYFPIRERWKERFATVS